MNVSNSIALVTGAAQNIGNGIANALAARGCQVTALDLNKEKLDEIDNGTFSCMACDAADPAQAECAVESVIARNGRIDLLVNAAGWICSAPLYNLLDRKNGKHDIGLWEKTLRSNLTTTFVMGACVAEAMVRARTKGAIVNISSVAARGNAGQSAYAAAKAGVNALTVTWAKELGALGIRAVAIAPGFIDTPSTHEAMSEDRLRDWIAKTPLRRLGLIEQVAQAVVFAAENDYLTGTVIELDGGLRM
jgi:3-oxoacyl-[acyl-carrier protein] reductase